MTIIRWQNRPFVPNTFQRFFENEFPTRFERNCGCSPAVNILEKDEQFEIQMAAPGMSKEDFKIELEKNLLTISFERKEENQEQEGQRDDQRQENQRAENWIRKEFDMDSFSRSFTIPEQTDAEQITAKYENGILYVGVPRENPEKARLSKRIEIA
jgi:HSP20 family protein